MAEDADRGDHGDDEEVQNQGRHAYPGRSARSGGGSWFSVALCGRIKVTDGLALLTFCALTVWIVMLVVVGHGGVPGGGQEVCGLVLSRVQFDLLIPVESGSVVIPDSHHSENRVRGRERAPDSHW